MLIYFSEGNRGLNNVLTSPIPAKEIVPEWYKNIKPDRENSNIKSCMPFLDSLLSGYIQTTWAEISYDENVEELVSELCPYQIIGKRDKASVTTTEEYFSTEYVWKRHWIPKLPDGYSLLITHPLNRLDLPFTTISAIVDADVALPYAMGNIPFYLKKSFKGTIPIGTPMFQMIPFKRDSWEKRVLSYDDVFEEHKSLINGFEPMPYQKHLWNKKDYH